MAKVDLIMPKMGESIIEATILKWSKQVGDKVDLDETVLEIATDKVDSEIPSPVEGTLSEILFKEGDVVAVGKAIARIETGAAAPVDTPPAKEIKAPVEKIVVEKAPEPAPVKIEAPAPVATPLHVSPTPSPLATNAIAASNGQSKKFYSPLVKNIAAKENIALAELDSLVGTGANGRVTKRDILGYVANRSSNGATTIAQPATSSNSNESTSTSSGVVSMGGADEIIQMDRMRKLIADHMVRSKHTSPHVTSFIEVDVTNVVNWRNANKNLFLKKYGQKITYTPIIIEAVVKGIRDFPMINVSVDGDKIIVKKNINIGMATALPSGNLIVPVIKNADRFNMKGLAMEVNDLAGRARNNKLKPEDIQGGTFTMTNVGTFGNVMGTPIINQPQVAIMAAGAIRKKPAVLETPEGDVIAIRHMMFLSLSYDHRVVDGFLGGSYLRKVGDYLEAFDKDQKV